MRIYTSYFYQIRFFPPNLVPLSTAMFDPKWYHDNKAQSYQFKDKRGVLNGLRIEPFVPGPMCHNLCHGPETCYEHPDSCSFLLGYLGQLNQLNFEQIMQRFVNLSIAIKSKENLDDVDFALIVHEAPTKECSERAMIQRWFAANGYQVNEWSKDSI